MFCSWKFLSIFTYIHSFPVNTAKLIVSPDLCGLVSNSALLTYCHMISVFMSCTSAASCCVSDPMAYVATNKATFAVLPQTLKMTTWRTGTGTPPSRCSWGTVCVKNVWEAGSRNARPSPHSVNGNQSCHQIWAPVPGLEVSGVLVGANRCHSVCMSCICGGRVEGCVCYLCDIPECNAKCAKVRLRLSCYHGYMYGLVTVLLDWPV